jgi:hypothetical protein
MTSIGGNDIESREAFARWNPAVVVASATGCHGVAGLKSGAVHPGVSIDALYTSPLYLVCGARGACQSPAPEVCCALRGISHHTLTHRQQAPGQRTTSMWTSRTRQSSSCHRSSPRAPPGTLAGHSSSDHTILFRRKCPRRWRPQLAANPQCRTPTGRRWGCTFIRLQLDEGMGE